MAEIVVDGKYVFDIKRARCIVDVLKDSYGCVVYLYKGRLFAAEKFKGGGYYPDDDVFEKINNFTCLTHQGVELRDGRVYAYFSTEDKNRTRNWLPRYTQNKKAYDDLGLDLIDSEFNQWDGGY